MTSYAIAVVLIVVLLVIYRRRLEHHDRARYDEIRQRERLRTLLRGPRK